MKVIRSAEARAKNWHDEPRAYYQFEDLEVCLVESALKDYESAYHAHGFPEVVLCLEGALVADVHRSAPIGESDETTYLDPGDIIYFEPGERHRVHRPEPGAKLIVIKLGPHVRE